MNAAPEGPLSSAALTAALALAAPAFPGLRERQK
jgi:hypothetical protein